MQYRASSHDFKQTGKLATNPNQIGMWFVCDEYMIRGDAIVAKYPYLGYPHEERWKGYSPLRTVPDLFLKFARLYEEPDFEGAVLAWSRKYGVPSEDPQGSADPLGRLTIKDKIPLTLFRQQVKVAWVVLRMYESVPSRNAQAIRILISMYREDEDLSPISLPVLSPACRAFFIGEASVEEVPKAHLIAFANAESVLTVNYVMRELCYLQLPIDPKLTLTGVPNPDGTRSQWRFINLLGAMFLQMFWLIDHGGTLTRCEYCNRIISNASPAPGARKPRQDRRFCDVHVA